MQHLGTSYNVLDLLKPLDSEETEMALQCCSLGRLRTDSTVKWLKLTGNRYTSICQGMDLTHKIYSVSTMEKNVFQFELCKEIIPVH